MTKIEVCVDPGGSQTKVIYRVKSSERPRSLLFEPELEEIASENLTRYLERESVMSNPPAVRQAYNNFGGSIAVFEARSRKAF